MKIENIDIQATIAKAQAIIRDDKNMSAGPADNYHGEPRRAKRDQDSSSTASAMSRPIGMFWGHLRSASA